MASGGNTYSDGGKVQTETQGGGGNQTQQLAGIPSRLQNKYGSRPWFASAVSLVEPIFDKLDQAQGETVCLEKHGSTVSIMKQRQTSQSSQGR